MRQRIQKYKTVIFGLLALLLGLAMIYVGLRFDSDERLFDDFVLALGQSLLVGSTTSIVYEHILRSKMTEILHDTNSLQQQADLIGLRAIQVDLHDHNFKDMLLNQPLVTLVLNNGRTWSSTNQALLRQRYEKYKSAKSPHLVVIVMHPESPCLALQAEKEQKRKEELVDAISALRRTLISVGATDRNTTLLGHPFFSPQSIYQCDDYVIVTPYYIAPGKDKVPFYRYEDSGKHGYFQMLKRDIDRLRSHSQPISLSAS